MLDLESLGSRQSRGIKATGGVLHDMSPWFRGEQGRGGGVEDIMLEVLPYIGTLFSFGGVRRGLSLSVGVDRLDEPIGVSSGIIYSAGVDGSVRNIFTTAHRHLATMFLFLRHLSVTSFWVGGPKLQVAGRT